MVYRFQLKVGAAAYQVVTPIWGKSKISTKRQDGEMFHRKAFDGELCFMKADFDLLNDAAFETEFILKLEKYVSGSWVTKYPLMKFYKTDCFFDNDDGKCIVKPDSFDQYRTILAGLNKEYNLIDITPKTTPVTFVVQPVFQVYFQGSNVVNNLLGGVFFEVPVADNSGLLINDYKFGYAGSIGIMVGVGEGLSPDVSGEYVNDSASTFRSKSGTYRVVNVDLGGGNTQWEIQDFATSTTLYKAPINTAFAAAVFTSETSSSQTVFRTQSVYMRILTNETTIGGTPTSDIPTSDIVSSHGNYKKVHGIGVGVTGDPIYGTTWQDVLVASDAHQTTPERFGKFPDAAFLFGGEYYSPPNGSGFDSIYPLSQSEWGDAAFYFQYDSVLRAFQESGATSRTINEAYKLSDAIAAILAQIAPGVSHSDLAACSNFLYANGTNPIRGTRKVPVIVPKSNVTVGEYDQPAKKAEIRMNDILQLLRFFYKCFWHVTLENLFVIEHYQYYRNGGSYTAETVGTDLTGTFSARANKPYSFQTSKYEFDKQELPERIETTFGDKVSRAFAGYAINVLSKFIQEGNIEQNTISRFNPDLDFISVAPGEVSNTGFVFLECVEDGSGNLSVPFVEFSVTSNESYKMQNGYASMLYAHDKYHRHGLPATSVNLNRQDITATSTVRAKVQKVGLPVSGDIDTAKLVTTQLGNGFIENVEEDLETGWHDIELRLNTQ